MVSFVGGEKWPKRVAAAAEINCKNVVPGGDCSGAGGNGVCGPIASNHEINQMKTYDSIKLGP